METENGFYVSDTEAVRSHSIGLYNEAQEFAAKMNSFLGSMRDLKNVGKNITELEPIFDSIAKELKSLEEVSLQTIHKFAMYLVQTIETEEGSISF